MRRARGGPRKKVTRYIFSRPFPPRATHASHSPRFGLCWPKIRKQITPVLQTITREQLISSTVRAFWSIKLAILVLFWEFS